MKNFNGIYLLEVKDLSDKLMLSEKTIVNYLKCGRIKGQKIGQSWYVTEQNLERFIKGE